MSNLAQNIQRFRELNEKRTQGEWYAVTGTRPGEHLPNVIYIANSPTPKAGDTRASIARVQNVVSERPLDAEDYANAEFLSSAPEMQSTIEQLVTLNKQLHGALESYVIYHSGHSMADRTLRIIQYNGREALTASAQLAEIGGKNEHTS